MRPPFSFAATLLHMHLSYMVCVCQLVLVPTFFAYVCTQANRCLQATTDYYYYYHYVAIAGSNTDARQSNGQLSAFHILACARVQQLQLPLWLDVHGMHSNSSEHMCTHTFSKYITRKN